RVDQGEVREVGLEVDSEAMQGNAVTLGHPDCGDLPGARPDADVVFADVRLDTDLGKGCDDCLLEQLHVARNGEPAGAQADDGIPDELAGTVVGDQAPARGALEGDATAAQLLF